MQKRQVKIEMLNPSRCLTQSRSPKQNVKLTQPLILKQITQLIKNSKERNTERLCKPYEKLNYIQNIQPSTTSRPMQSHDLSTTFHQLLQEFRNYKKQNKENSFNKINKPFKKGRQISFPNAIHLNNSSNNINSIKDKLYLNKRESNSKLAQTILSIAQTSHSQNNYRLQFNGIIEDCSQKQYNYLYEVKKNMKNDNSHYKKNSQRCASADIQLVVRSTNKKTRSSSIDRNESRFLGSTQANSNPKEIDLTCDENEIIVHNINFNERIGTEPDPLINQERQYLVDPYYLIKQNEITWLIRAIVIDWMMETAMGNNLKRQTFHLSIYYLDSYLSKKQANKKNIQLIGLTSLLIANKIEEVNPICLMQFQKAANNGYKQNDILNMELDILFTLKWQVNAPSYTYWINWFTDQWDIFASNNGINLFFRKSNEESYKLFRKLCQLIDCTLMDIQTLQYIPRTIIASFMYLIISFQLNVFDIDMLEVMSRTSMFLLNRDNQFNQIFEQFVSITFGFALHDILPAIQYTVGFYELQINYETPPGVALLLNTPLESNYEEFLSFQCYSKYLLEFVRQKTRD